MLKRNALYLKRILLSKTQEVVYIWVSYTPLANILFDVIILSLPVSRFLPTFSMLFSRPDRSENHHRTFSCNFFRVHHICFLILPDYFAFIRRRIKCNASNSRSASWSLAYSRKGPSQHNHYMKPNTASNYMWDNGLSNNCTLVC